MKPFILLSAFLLCLLASFVCGYHYGYDLCSKHQSYFAAFTSK